MLTPFERGLIANLIADWLLQNDWIARNKTSLKHPAAWTHGAIHALLIGLAIGWRGGVVLGLFHMLIDTRVPARWWSGFIHQTPDGPIALILRVAVDQVLHVAAIAAWIGIAARFGW